MVPRTSQDFFCPFVSCGVRWTYCSLQGMMPQINTTLRHPQTERKQAGVESAGNRIRTMSLYSGHSDRKRSCTHFLSECALHEFIVLIMAPSRSLPTRFLSVEAFSQTDVELVVTAMFHNTMTTHMSSAATYCLEVSSSSTSRSIINSLTHIYKG